jgi:hypothetical protein
MSEHENFSAGEEDRTASLADMQYVGSLLSERMDATKKASEDPLSQVNRSN